MQSLTASRGPSPGASRRTIQVGFMQVIVPKLRSHGRFAWTSWRLRCRVSRDEKTSYPFPVVRVPAAPLPGYPGFRLGLPGRRVRAALIRHQAELVHLASPVVLGAHGAAWRVRWPPDACGQRGGGRGGPAVRDGAPGRGP
jgi:hypothetical protein